MQAIGKHPCYFNYAVNLIAGILFVFAVITVFGYGAAVAIPKSILEPLALFSPTLAFSLVDLFTQGIPAALLFVLCCSAMKLLKIQVVCTLLAIPFVLFMLSAVPELLLIPESSGLYLATFFAKVLPVVLCVLFMAKRDSVRSGA